MHPRSWIVVGLFAALTAQSAVVYKWTDAAGVVHFSDQPVPGAEKIVTAGTSLNGYAAPAASNANTPPPRQGAPPAKAPSEQHLTIVAPQPGQNYFNDEPITISLSQPNLDAEQSVIWHLNGQDLTDQSPGATQFVLPNPGRGTFEISATITNQKTGDVQATDSVTFYVHEPSALSPQHRNP